MLEEQIAKYRNLKNSYRIAICIFLGLLYPAYDFQEQWEISQARLEQTQREREAAEKQFLLGKKQKDDLPRLEEKLQFTENELKEASKKLPNDFKMDDILQKATLIASETGLYLEAFVPGEGTPSGVEYKYVEMPIQTKITGTFDQILRFYDRLVHLDLLVYVRNISIGVTKGIAVAQKEIPEDQSKAKTDEKTLAGKSKMTEIIGVNNKLNAIAEVVVFRSLTDIEINEMQKVAGRNPGQAIMPPPSAPAQAPPPSSLPALAPSPSPPVNAGAPPAPPAPGQSPAAPPH